MASSRDVAEYFGKRHKDVLRHIDRLDCSPEFNGRNFTPIEYLDERRRMKPGFEMTKCPSGDFMSRMNRLSGAPLEELNQL